MKLHNFIKKSNERKYLRRRLWHKNSKIRMYNNLWLDENNNPYSLTVYDVNANDWEFAKEEKQK